MITPFNTILNIFLPYPVQMTIIFVCNNDLVFNLLEGTK